jgi:uncharacterized protein YihD (DUF1040 family)
MLELIAGIIEVIAIAGFQYLLEITRNIHFEMQIAELRDLILVDVLTLRRFEKDYFLNGGKSDKQADYLFLFIKAEESLKAHTSELLALAAGNRGMPEEMKKSAAVLPTGAPTMVVGPTS